MTVAITKGADLCLLKPTTGFIQAWRSTSSDAILLCFRWITMQHINQIKKKNLVLQSHVTMAPTATNLGLYNCLTKMLDVTCDLSGKAKRRLGCHGRRLKKRDGCELMMREG